MKAAAHGYRGTLRIALSDGIALPRLATLLAQCREKEPEVEIRLFEIPQRPDALTTEPSSGSSSHCPATQANYFAPIVLSTFS